MRRGIWFAGLLILVGCKSNSSQQNQPDADVLACASVTDCTSGDRCCPAGCAAATDGDCSATCGNGTVDPNETCDPPDSCPSSCGDGDVCTKDVVVGSAANCNVACANTPITMCTGGDGCCPSGCDNNSDPDCPPPAGTALPDRLTVSMTTTPAGVITGDTSFRIWGQGSLRIGPVFTVPFADCGTLVGYTTGTASAPRARVARLDTGDALVTTYDLGAYVLRGLAAEPDGHFAALLWDVAPATKTLTVKRYTSNGTAGWSTVLPSTVGEPTAFTIGESRLEYGAAKYAAYFHIHGTSGQFNGHEGDALHTLDATTGANTTNWEWGCSHSMSDLLRYSPSGSAILPICITDCFPGTTPDGSANPFAATSIGGVYLSNSTKVQAIDGGCNGSVAGELGGAAAAIAGWKLVFDAHQAATTLGQSSYSTSTMNQDIGFVSIAANKTPGSVVWLTTTSGNEENSSIARWVPMGGTGEQYVVGWSSGTTYTLARVSDTGSFLENPTTITTAKWGERDDPFRTHLNGDIVWAWFDSAGSTTLKLARLHSGGTAPSCAALP